MRTLIVPNVMNLRWLVYIFFHVVFFRYSYMFGYAVAKKYDMKNICTLNFI